MKFTDDLSTFILLNYIIKFNKSNDLRVYYINIYLTDSTTISLRYKDERIRNQDYKLLISKYE